MTAPPFDPYTILEALERRRVAYVLIGGFARIIQGTEELTDGLDLTPSLRGDNVRRLRLALQDIGAERAHGTAPDFDASIPSEPVIELQSPSGVLKLVPDPAGTRGGYDDLRRAATREPLGRGLRPSVASIADLARMAAALGREQDKIPLRQLRKLSEIEHRRGREIER